MNQTCLFSSGLDLANFVVSSNLLHLSCNVISELYRERNQSGPTLPLSVKYKDYPLPSNGAIIAFVPSAPCTVNHLQEEGRDLVSSAILRNSFNLFEFLSTKGNPSFSIHRAAMALFANLYHELSRLKDKFCETTPLIITGHSLGGSIASLFTLWLLESISPKSPKRPLICITFGSPLIGDEGFQQAILNRPTWNSCFLHVASNQDLIPKLFISSHNAPNIESTSSQTSPYKPFGTFLLCSESGCACFEEPESILELLVAVGSETLGNQSSNEGLQIVHYKRIFECLEIKAICKGISELDEWLINSLWAGISLQLESIGVKISQQQHGTIAGRAETAVEKVLRRNDFTSSKTLNERKINMTHLEWYKKVSKDHGGYYDSYKNVKLRFWSTAVLHHRTLTNYWKQMVAEAEKMPQREGASFRVRWLYAGTNYRRMVEPLDIADYYKKGKKEYLTQARSEHYVLLEQWLKDDRYQITANERNKACSQTEDSCFWAHVEEAIISCNLLNDGETREENREMSKLALIKFEQYVMGLINNYAASPEIFLEQSSFMKWWRQYQMIVGSSYNSPLTDFMRTHRYRQYN